MALPGELRALAGAPNFATLSLILDDQVRSYVMWVDVVDTDLVIVSPGSSAKTRELVPGAVATLLVWRQEHPYDYAEVRCRVRATTGGEPARTMIEQTLAMKYRGTPYLRPDVAEWTMVHLQPERTRLW